MRSVPLTYSELATLIGAGAYPWERTWIDFKKRLYPDDPSNGKGRAETSLELARDMASMAVLGGYLVYGVDEDKSKHRFTVDAMKLPVGLHETVDAVARSRITPPLNVSPFLVPDLDDTTRGFLVIEIPPSPDAPHMVEGIYWGRSETGKVRLIDADVERLILARSRRVEYLADAMMATARSDPAPSSQYCHFYFTAVPATGWPDMLADHARDRASRRRLGQLCINLLSEIERTAGGSQRRPAVAFEYMINDWRSQEVAAGWLSTWAADPKEDGGRALGVDDDGPVRYMNLGASGRLSVNNSVLFVRDLNLLFETWDMIRLIAALSDEIGYRGSWRFGVQLDHFGGHMSQVNDPAMGFVAGAGITWKAADYSRTTKATALEVGQKSTLVADRLLRQLLRGLGTEDLLNQPPFGPA
jgi:hypothetical protein